MESRPPITRRRAIAVVAAAGAGALTYSSLRFAASSGEEDAADHDGLAVLGRAYLEALDEPVDVSYLVDTLAIAPGPTRTDVRAHVPRLRANVRRDFTNGDVVQVGQWRLARTEAQIAGLIALLPA